MFGFVSLIDHFAFQHSMTKRTSDQKKISIINISSKKCLEVGEKEGILVCYDEKKRQKKSR